MPDLVYQALIRLAVILPAIVVFAVVLWYGLRRLGVMKVGAPLDPRDMRTWPLRLVVADAALFAVIFSVVLAVVGDSEWGAAVAGGVSALVSIGTAPLLVARFVR